MSEITKCLICDNVFVQKAKGAPRKTCSRRCRDIKRGAINNFKKELRKCKHCNKYFMPRTDKHVYCSAKCNHLYNYKRKLYTHVCRKCKKQYENNRPKSNYCSRDCYDSYNNKKHKELRNKNETIKRTQDSKYKITVYCQTMLSRSIRGRYRGKSKRWNEYFDFTAEQFIEHMQSLFISDMSFDNYGEWQIDHIKPKSDFNYNSVNDKEFKECWKLDNLRPLWKWDNINKRNKKVA
jgi:hypothetical protein